jgi:hypothetical protein
MAWLPCPLQPFCDWMNRINVTRMLYQQHARRRPCILFSMTFVGTEWEEIDLSDMASLRIDKSNVSLALPVC